MGLKIGDFSPAIGIATGKGAFGDLADKGLLGIAPRMIASKAQEKDERKGREASEREAMAQAALAKEQKAAAAKVNYLSAARVPTGGLEGYKPLKSGGKVKSASSRADGCAIRGKTKA
jgi:phage terminase Nu1 subunit (DNA packaging protein)